MSDNEWRYITSKVSEFKEMLSHASYSPSKSNFKVKYLSHNMTSPLLARNEHKYYENMLSAAKSDDDSIPLK